MTGGFYESVLARAETDGPALANSTSKTSILPAHAKYSSPIGQEFWRVGKIFRVRASGRVSTFTSGTLTLAFGVGAVDAFASQALTMAVSQTNQSWDLDLEMTVRAVGAGGSATANMFGMGKLSAAAAITAAITLLPASAPAVGTSFDPGAVSTLDLLATWSVSNAANSIQLHKYVLEELN